VTIKARVNRDEPFAFLRELATRWDLIAIVLVLGIVVLLGEASRGLLGSLASLESTPLSLDPVHLPLYAARTTLRMFAALGLSLLFTLTYATWAAKSPRAGKLLVPILDILQSVPILGFISITVAFFMSLAPGRVLGAELAAIFAIFTSQAWNMAFSFYQSLRCVPTELREAADSFRLSPWMRFWQLEVPFALPGLIWNAMLSMSGGWFFVVAAEAINVGTTHVALPGVGSYIALATERGDVSAICWAILIMLIVILVYDQLVFRPLAAWVDGQRFELESSDRRARSWALTVIRRSRIIAAVMAMLHAALRWTSWAMPFVSTRSVGAERSRRGVDALWLAGFVAAIAFGCWHLSSVLAAETSLSGTIEVTVLATITMLRVLVLIVLASVLWLPIGVWIGMRPRAMAIVQPIAQFMAAFPANLLFPLAVSGIVAWKLNPDVWLSPLMILGTQWYILFNVIAGASTIPGELRYAAENFQIRGWLWWRTVALPAVFPYYVTGAITASGGSWNASVVAELASWRGKQVEAHGLGAYIAAATAAGDFHRIVLGIATMSVFVVAINRLLWRPLYRYAERKFQLG
jgi:NitT/TauT family transport system permease protein